MATYLDAAGPSGAPAVVIHPDQELPKVWRVLSTWEHEGQRGAWLVHNNDGWRRAGTIAQLVYGEARLYAPANIGQGLTGATARLQCSAATPDRSRHYNVFAESPPERLAYYAERGEDIKRLDWHAMRLYNASGRPGPDDPWTGEPTPPIDRVPAPEPTDSDSIVKAIALGVAMDGVRIHPDSEWPEEWQRVTHATEWAYQSPATWVPIIPAADAPIRNIRGLRMQLTTWRHRQESRIYDAEHATTTSAPVAAPAPRQRPAGPPPAAGVERARWIGERITAMTARESSAYQPHTRRRIAAHRALSIVAGYTPEDAVNDGLQLPGGFLLHLEGLNQYAARAFAGQED